MINHTLGINGLKKSARKRSRPQDYDYEVDLAPDALSPQYRKAVEKPYLYPT